MIAKTGPDYLREIAMGLRRMGFPISAPSLEQLAAQWEADRARAERLTAAASGRGMVSEMDGLPEIAVLVMGLYARAERAEAANTQERGELSKLYSLLTGDDGAWSFGDFARAIKSQQAALAMYSKLDSDDGLASTNRLLAACERGDGIDQHAAPDIMAARAEIISLRAALVQARALANEWMLEDGETYGAKLTAQMGRRLAALLSPAAPGGAA